ncbi:hypothetical protein IV102_12200 [bacterium]|nr:hypothetical protein [bacterium]
MASRASVGTFLGGVALACGNGYYLAGRLVPWLVSNLEGWCEAERLRQTGIGLVILALVVPPFWLSHKLKKIRHKWTWFFRFLLFFQILIAGTLTYFRSAPAPAPRATPTPLVTPVAPATPMPKHLVVETPLASPTPEVSETPVDAETPLVKPPPQMGIPGHREEPNKYAKIDAYALATPPEMEKEVATLAHYLVKPAQNDEEKIRAIYRWVTDRIAYDADSFFSGNYPDGSPETSLQRRLAVCDGYSKLVHALGKQAGLKVEIVPGYASGCDADPTEEENHAWNAVKLPQGWRLIEATWGAGSLGEDRKFHKEFNPYYFEPPAEQLLATHFPTESRWQLLLPPITRKEFLSRPKKQPKFYDLGLKVVQQVGSLEADPRAVVELRAPDEVVLSARLESEQSTVEENTTMVDRDDNRILVNVMAPRKGKFRLLVFASKAGEDYMNGVLEYTIEALSGQPDGYAQTSSLFQTKGGHVFSPTASQLSAGKQHFELEIPGARTVFIDDWDNALQLEGDRFVGDLMVKPGKVNVFAQFEGERAHGVVTFEAR